MERLAWLATSGQQPTLADHAEHIAGRLPPVYDLPPALGRLLADYAAPGNGGFRRNPPGTTEAQARHLVAMLG